VRTPRVDRTGALLMGAAVTLLSGCDDGGVQGGGETAAARVAAGADATRDVLSAPDRALPDTSWVLAGTPEDWEILRGKIRWGRQNGLDTIPVGEAMARLGVTFVGTAYTPGTLEAPGPERVVVNLRELDCVTFVENVIAITDLIRDPKVNPDGEGAGLVARHAAALEAIRYRDGRLDGYPSRLHYFSEWIADHESRGMVSNVTAALGGVPYPDPVNFMSTHADAYPHLADPGNLAAIEGMEAQLAPLPRSKVPQEALAGAAAGIRNGDIIAATSTVPGLDIAHTGIALWQDGQLHLLHAPLVGKAVEISQVPLADRILTTKGQDGVMVARPTGAPLMTGGH
jgi:hypothetical protein